MSDDTLKVTLNFELPSGEVQEVSLSRKTPLSVGQHRENEVQIDDEIGAMHCRINWSDMGVELVAATSAGVIVNGTAVQRALLTVRDEVTIGEAKLTVSGKDAEEANKEPSASVVELKPVTQDDIFDDPWEKKLGDKEETLKPQKSPVKKKDPMESAVSAILDDEDFLGEEDTFGPSDEDEITRPRAESEEPEDVSEEDLDDEPEEGTDSKKDLRERLRERRERNAVRPGEEEILKSRLVQLLGGGSLALVVLSAVFYILFLSNDSQQIYDDAITLYEEQKYSQAINRFEEFIEKYPNNERTPEVKLKQGLSHIDREIVGSSGNWENGLREFDAFILKNRETKGFVIEQRSLLGDYAERITRGSIKSALKKKKREFLDISLEARKKVTAYGPEDKAELATLQKELDQLYREAESAVLKEEVFNDHLAQMKQAIEQKQPLVALQKRRALLAKYSDFENDKKLRKMMGEILSAEKSLVVSEELNRDALIEERETMLPPPITLAVHTRSQTAGQSEDEVVLIQTDNSCLGLDTITGQPLWQRVSGANAPFFPVVIDSSPEGVLYFDTIHSELTAVELKTGKLMWRQPLVSKDEKKEQLMGAPLVHGSTILVTTDQDNLYQLDLRTGRISVRLHFNQPLYASPALTADEEHCLLAGEQEVFYYLSLRPLSCQAVTHFGQLPGDIDIPMLAMGGLTLITQNTGADRCTLKVLNTAFPEEPNQFPRELKPVAQQTIAGRVVNAPFLRGKQLVVHSTGARLTAFTVSDEAGTPPLTPDASFQFQDKNQKEGDEENSIVDDKKGGVHLYIGPNGQLWLTYKSLRKLQINSDHFQLNPKATAEGSPVQPLQMQHEQAFVGRRHPFSPAVFFSQADRQRLDSYWRTICGAKMIGVAGKDKARLISVSDAGTVFQVSPDQLNGQRFLTRAVSQIRLDNEKHISQTAPQSVSLSNGQLLVYWGSENPFYTTVTATGQVRPVKKLNAPVEAAPVEIDAGIVLPVKENLVLIPRAGSRLVTSPFDSPDSKWKTLMPVGENDFLALTTAGILSRFEFSTGSPNHFKELTSSDLRVAIDVDPVMVGGNLIVATSEGKLLAVETETLSIRETVDLPSAATQNLWNLAGTVLVQTGSKLSAYALDGGLSEKWSVPLPQGLITQKPLLMGGQIVAVDASGRVLQINFETGESKDLGQLDLPLSMPLFQFGNEIIGATVDGSLHRLQGLLETQP